MSADTDSNRSTVHSVNRFVLHGDQQRSVSQQSMATSTTPRRLSSHTTLQRMSMEENASGSGQPGTAIIIHTDPSSMSTVDSQGRVGLSSLQVVPRRWATLDTAKRCLLVLSVVFLVIGVILTVFGFAGRPRHRPTQPNGYLALQVGGPVCLATTAVMLILGGVFSRLWKVEWRRRQRAMELRARVRLHALAMDMIKKPTVSPRVLQDPLLRRDLLLSLHQQSAMDMRYRKLLQLAIIIIIIIIHVASSGPGHSLRTVQHN